jgi:antirestriction protein ArdC
MATKARINYGGDRAFYASLGDYITLPNPVDFASYEHYLATALHELAHWSATLPG